MAVTIKNEEEIKKMRVAGRLAADVLDMITPHVCEGVSTDELNTLCHRYITEDLACIPAPLNYGYPPFPKSICTSLNHVICHGIPSDRRLRNGDILNIDVTVIKDGYHGDTSMMYIVGEGSVLARRLCEITHRAMWIGIDMVRPGIHLGDIGYAIQSFVEKERFSVVREFCGHGIGRGFHEEPQVLHYGQAGTGLELKEGMIFTIEPMINAGKAACKILGDQWTVVTRDHSLSAQWEHTVLVTSQGHEVLTLRADERAAKASPVA